MGFILGVVVGLGLALAVAVYVTKVPILFVNKAKVATPNQDATEPKKTRTGIPTRRLYGKNPAKPVELAC